MTTGDAEDHSESLEVIDLGSEVDTLIPKPRPRRRGSRTNVTTGLVVIVAATVLVITLVVVTHRTGTHSARTTTTSATSTVTSTSTLRSVSIGPQVRVFAGLPHLDASLFRKSVVAVTTVRVPNGQPVLAFLGAVRSTWWISTSSPASSLGGEALPLDGSVTPLQTSGDPMSFAEGGGARWIYERQYQNPGQQYRLERFSDTTPPTVLDNPVPVDGQPAGALAAGDGGVWIPLRNGVARMDTRTGKLVAMLPLPFDESRSLVLFRSRIVVSGRYNAIRTIDPATNSVSSPHVLGPKGSVIYGLANVDGHLWVDLEQTSTSQSLVRLDGSLHIDAKMHLPVGPEFFAMQSANGRLWLLAGLRIGVPQNEGATDQAVILIDPATASVTRTVVLHGYADAVAWTAPKTLLFSDLQPSPSNGSVLTTLYKITLDPGTAH